jgi:aspartate aminotransferase
MGIPIAKRIADSLSSASLVREMFERGRRLKQQFGDANVYDFSLGNPNAAPPPEFTDALRAVAAENQPARHRYMPNAGFDETRAAVAAFLSTEYRTKFDAGSIVLTCGAAAGLNITLRALCDPGDEVLVLAPYFPEYRFYIEQSGAVMVVVGTDSDFQPCPAAIAAAITPRTRALLVNSPNNPSGAVYTDGVLRGISDVLQRADRGPRPIYLVTDDPYRRILYDRPWCPTPIAHYARSIVVSSYSKDLSIAGERAGYVALPPQLPDRGLVLNALIMLNRTLGFVNMPAFMQRVVARCAAACCDLRFYRENRDLLCDALRDFGYELNVPAGALYAFPRTPIADDAAFVDVLTRHRILAVPGRGFGTPGHMRLSFCVDRPTIERSLPAFQAAIQEVRRTAAAPAAALH